MKLLHSLFLLLIVSVVCSQELDLDFGEGGVAPSLLLLDNLIEYEDQIILNNQQGILSLDRQGNINTDFGDEGFISEPFFSTSFDFITHTHIINDRLVIIGCSFGGSDSQIDLFVSQVNMTDGLIDDELRHVYHSTGDQEYSCLYEDEDQLKLFGYDLHLVDGGTKVYSGTIANNGVVVDEIESCEQDLYQPICMYPRFIKQLSDGQSLIVYSRINLNNNYYQLVNDVSQILEIGDTEPKAFPSSIRLDSDLVELSEGMLLVHHEILIAGHASFRSELRLFDVTSDKSEVVQLAQVEDDVRILSLTQLDEQSFLIITENADELGNKNCVMRCFNKDLSQNLEFGEAGVITMAKTYEDIRSVSVFVTDRYFYINVNGNDFESSLSRYKKTKSTSMASGTDLGFVQLYPNPAFSILHLDGLAVDQTCFYEVYNAAGCRLKTGVLEQAQLDISDLQSGMHLFHLKTANNNFTKSFVVK